MSGCTRKPRCTLSMPQRCTNRFGSLCPSRQPAAHSSYKYASPDVLFVHPNKRSQNVWNCLRIETSFRNLFVQCALELGTFCAYPADVCAQPIRFVYCSLRFFHDALLSNDLPHNLCMSTCMFVYRELPLVHEVFLTSPLCTGRRRLSA